MSNLTVDAENIINKLHTGYFTFSVPFMAIIKCTHKFNRLFFYVLFSVKWACITKR